MMGTNLRNSWPLPATQVANARLTWTEWCAAQARQIARQQQFGDLPFREREVAHLAFLRWLYQTQRIVP